LVFHELIPGHELQGYMAAHFRPYRTAVGGTPFVTEGELLSHSVSQYAQISEAAVYVDKIYK